MAGDFATLATLTAEIDATDPAPADRGSAERLQRKALRNARLLEAAARGVRAARQRMVEIRQGGTLTTYDSRGQKAQVAPLASFPHKRV